MNKIIVFLTILLLFSVNSYAEIVYSNLGPGGSYSSNNGYSISYPSSAYVYGQSSAYSFIPLDNYQLTSVDLPMSSICTYYPSCSHDFAVGIYSDNNNSPGTLLTSTTGTAPLLPFGPPASLTSVTFSGSTELASGNRYWIGLHPSDTQPHDMAWWWTFSENQSLRFASVTPSEVLLGGSWEISSMATESAFQINGTPVFPKPVPDIKANGSDGPVIINPGDNLTVSIALDPGSNTGDNADWWINLFYYNQGTGSFVPIPLVSFQRPLVNMGPINLINTSSLPQGTFVFFFGVDTDPNGVMDPAQMYFDIVGVVINHSTSTPSTY